MKTSEQPLVSVVVPCLNRAQFLVPTIESILQQDYPNIECIVIDGGSTDGTIEILKNYGDRIKWVSEPDKGHADAINKGWKMSKGEILAWLNADDMYVVPYAVRRAVEYFQNHQGVDVVYGDYKVVSEEGRVISDTIKPRKWDLVYAVKYCHYIIPQPTSFIRRSILEKVNWLDPEFKNGKDHDLWLRIALIGGRIEYTPILFAYVRHCKGLSQRIDIAEAKVRINEKFLSNPDLPPPFTSNKFRRCAMSNAYLVGSLYILDCGIHPLLTLKYLSKAITTDPLNFLYITITFLRKFLGIILPNRWKQVIKGVIKCFGKFFRKLNLP